MQRDGQVHLCLRDEDTVHGAHVLEAHRNFAATLFTRVGDHAVRTAEAGASAMDNERRRETALTALRALRGDP